MAHEGVNKAEIRDARPEDLPDILRIYNHAVLHTAATFDLRIQTLEERREWFSHYGGVHPLIVAESAGKVIGYSCLSPFRTKPAYSRTVEISIYVDVDFRGQGIGNRLMEEILKRAVEHGHHVVVAGITAGNETSVKLHEKFGFKLAGRFEEVGYKFDAWQDVLFYQLLLP